MRLILLSLLFLLTGCQSLFFKATQGNVTNIGVTLPSNNTLDLQIASYLNGDIITVKDKSEITYSWQTSETNSYFGIITTQNNRKGKIKIK
jgi:hypothetical protein